MKIKFHIPSSIAAYEILAYHFSIQIFSYLRQSRVGDSPFLTHERKGKREIYRQAVNCRTSSKKQIKNKKTTKKKKKTDV